VRVPTEPPRGLRVNATGAYRPFGPPDQAPLVVETRLRTRTERPAYGSAEHVAFLRRTAGIPDDAAPDVRLPRPCVVLQDNYSVHVSAEARAAYAELERHGLIVRQLPANSPDLNRIEPCWRWAKYRGLRERCYADGPALQTAVEDACRRYRRQTPRRRRNSDRGT
jgi:transposase